MTNIINSASAPQLFATSTTSYTNATGDGTVFQMIFNSVIQGGNINTSTGVFTCTIAGTFLFCITPELGNLSALTANTNFTLVTTLGSFQFSKMNASTLRSSAAVCQFGGYIIAKMNLNDTAFLDLSASGGSKTLTVNGSPTYLSIARLF
jgi:hypothetical protein